MNLYNEIRPIFDEIPKYISEDFLEEFKNTPPDSLINYHFGFGFFLRNSFIYRNKSLLDIFKNAGMPHPDDISLFIMREYRKYLLNNNEPTG